MGSTFSKVVDIGLRVLCVATCGQLGKSSEGYHVGPLRLKEDSVGFAYNVGICDVGLNVGRNEFGNIGLDASISSKIPGFGKGSVRAGIDTEGCYGGISGRLNVGSLETSGGVVVNSKGIRSYGAKAVGPLLTNVKYSSDKGLAGGIFGVSANKAGEVNYDILEKEIVDTIGKTVKDEYKLCQDEEQREDKKTEDEVITPVDGINTLSSQRAQKMEKDRKSITEQKRFYINEVAVKRSVDTISRFEKNEDRNMMRRNPSITMKSKSIRDTRQTISTVQYQRAERIGSQTRQMPDVKQYVANKAVDIIKRNVNKGNNYENGVDGYLKRRDLLREIKTYSMDERRAIYTVPNQRDIIMENGMRSVIGAKKDNAYLAYGVAGTAYCHVCHGPCVLKM